MTTTRGRPVAIPPELWGRCFNLYAQGFGCRRVAYLLEDEGILVSKSSVHALLTGKGTYKGRRIAKPEKEKEEQ